MTAGRLAALGKPALSDAVYEPSPEKWRLILRRERTLPIGNYPADAASENPRQSAPASNARVLPGDIVLDLGSSEEAVTVDKAASGDHAGRERQQWLKTDAGELLLDAFARNGIWTLGPDGSKWRTVDVDFSLREPDLMLDGLLWLAKSPPTLRDALPDLEDFVGALTSVPLSTNQSPFRFASPLKLNCDFTITARSADGTMPTARLDKLTVSVEHDPRARLKETWFKGTNGKAFLAPLMWRRHPSLPFIQSLPLTQTQDPPAHPCASRELAPFDLPWGLPARSGLPEIDPTVWLFESGTRGAANWLSASAHGAAAEWLETRQPVLPLASLSLPGLALQPGAATDLPGESGLGLRVQYEYGLPYLDQLNAFAQLPKDDDDDYRGGLFSGRQHTAPEDKQRRPLGRRDFKTWWKELSTKRFLARTEAADALVNQSADDLAPQFAVRGLIEPLDWVIAPPEADLSSYPGRLQLSNADNSSPLVLEGPSALRGFDGYFGVAAGALIRRSERQDGDFQIIAGSMRAWQPAANGMIRDQRGLSRGPRRRLITGQRRSRPRR